jgi:hypothetical protein
MAVNRFGSMAAFAGHRTGSSGGGDYLKNWKKAAVFDAWFHTQVLPIAVWVHGFPKTLTVKGVKHVWLDMQVCPESESVLDEQYFRAEKGEPTSPRKKPPQRCGICKLVEWAYQQCFLFEDHREENEAFIAAGKLGKVKGIRFTTPIFKFEADVPTETQIYYLGGICNLLKKEMGDAQKKDLLAAKIPKTAVWSNSQYAKCKYAMCVVNNDRPDDGVQIAIETSGLADSVKAVFNTTLESLGRDIETDPYVVRWKYHKDADLPNDKYSALAMPAIKLSPRIAKLIRGEVPTEALQKATRPANQQLVRLMLETHCVLPPNTVPWDDLFPTAAQEKKWAEEQEAEEAEAEEAAGHPGHAQERAPGDDDEEDEAEAEELFECDNPKCKKPVKGSDAECPHCGHKYEVADKEEAEEVEEEVEEAPPPKKLPSRAEVLAAKAAAAKGGTKAKAKPAEAEDDDQGAEIPF